MKLQYILVILILHCTMRRAHAKVYSVNDEVIRCSRLLTDIIYNLCENSYKIVKRDTSSMLIEKMAPRDLQVETVKQHLSTAPRSRVRRQVADECCLRPCTVADIISYCPNDAKLIRERPDIFEKL